jgi:Fic family protein
LRNLLSDLTVFMNSAEDLDPLVRLAVGHYQFEAIHPFADGNGRTGRVLNLLHLVEYGLLDVPVLYLSRFILDNRQQYYKGLRSVTEDHAWQDWILFMIEGVRSAAQNTLAKVGEVLVSMNHAAELIRRENSRIYTKDLVEAVFTLPYCKAQFLIDARITAQRKTASRYLQELARIGVLRELRSGREKYFINDRLIDMMMGVEFSKLDT